ncbi:MAG: hypothetical protein SPE84_07930, partial [Bullifex sp.]|nr:hypothetical protein [Bullifex sp.]
LKLDLRTLIAGNETKVEIKIKDGEEVEATISGSTTFKAADGKLTISFDLTYTEYDDGKTEEDFSVEGSFSLDLDPKSFTDILNNLKNIADVTIKVNGMNVWAEAFLAELD